MAFKSPFLNTRYVTSEKVARNYFNCGLLISELQYIYILFKGLRRILLMTAAGLKSIFILQNREDESKLFCLVSRSGTSLQCSLMGGQ